jgi:hypothetical protein
MSSPLEIYRYWRAMQDARIVYQDTKTALMIVARDNTGLSSLVDADGCRWRVTVGNGPSPVVTVQAIAHLSDVKGVPGAASEDPGETSK